MVKKGLLAIAAVVLLVILGTGVLIGAQFAGGTADTPTQTTDSQSDDGGGSSTATATAGNSTTPTPTPEANGTTTPTETATPQQESIPAREFNEQNVSNYVRQFLNEEREAAGVPPFESGLQTEADLNEMAKGHSEQMAIEGKAIHKIDGVSSEDRYENAGLYDRCTFKSAEGDYIEQPDRNRFEAVERRSPDKLTRRAARSDSTLPTKRSPERSSMTGWHGRTTANGSRSATPTSSASAWR